MGGASEAASGSRGSLGAGRATEKGGSGRCRSCGVELIPGRRFCPTCGVLVSSGRSADAGALRHPGWHVVVDGMSRIYWGTLTLVFALVFAAAASTVINLFSLDFAEGGLQAALMGASAIGVALGFALLLWGDILDLRIPSPAQGRWHALVVLLLGGGAAVSGILALGSSASSGFDPDRIPSGASLLGALALLLLVGRLVAFAALLRRLAFALRNYRIAQGSVGFILYVGIGFAVVGLLGLLFREASSSAQTFGELLGLAFVSGLALWSLGMARRSRDLVRQRLA